jgi:signal recognition particle subunit SRP14
MVLLENEQFLTELTKFYQKAHTSGTVVVTMKRYDGRTKPVPKPNSKNNKKATSSLPLPIEIDEYKCLLRASMGSKKLSTVISPKDLNKFQLAYSNLIRGNIELKKKEKKTTATTTTTTTTTITNKTVNSKSKTNKKSTTKAV